MSTGSESQQPRCPSSWVRDTNTQGLNSHLRPIPQPTRSQGTEAGQCSPSVLRAQTPRLGGVESAGAEGAEGQAWLLGRTRWVMRVSGWAEAGGWVGACSCSRVAPGRLVTLPFSSRHLAGCSLPLGGDRAAPFHQLSGSASLHCSPEDVRARCAVRLSLFSGLSGLSAVWSLPLSHGPSRGWRSLTTRHMGAGMGTPCTHLDCNSRKDILVLSVRLSARRPSRTFSRKKPRRLSWDRCWRPGAATRLTGC